jgi:hypothetical protein
MEKTKLTVDPQAHRIIFFFTIGVGFGSHWNWSEMSIWFVSMTLSVYIITPFIEKFYDKYIA